MRRKSFGSLLAAAVLAAGGAIALVPAGQASAATPTCNWVASWYGAWVPNYGTTSVNVNCNLVQGTNSPAVRQLQHTLNLCYGEHLTEDGDFGSLTKAALIRAQRAAGTPADGEYGPNTRKAIRHEPVNGGGCIRVP